MNHSPSKAGWNLKGGFCNLMLQDTADSHNHLKYPAEPFLEEVRLVVGNPQPSQHYSCPLTFVFPSAHGAVPHVLVSLRTTVPGSLVTLWSHLDVSASYKVSAKEMKPDSAYTCTSWNWRASFSVCTMQVFAYLLCQKICIFRHCHQLCYDFPPWIYRGDGLERCHLTDSSAKTCSYSCVISSLP